MKIIVISAILSLLRFPVFAQDPSVITDDFRVYSSLDTNVLYIGQQTRLFLRAEVTAGNDVSLPILQDTLTSSIEIVNRTKTDTAYSPDRKKYFITQAFTITSFDTGYFVIPPFRFILNNDSNRVAETEPILITILGVAVDTTKDIMDIKEPMSVPITLMELLPYIGIGLAVIALAAGLIYFLVKRKKKIPEPVAMKPKEPPHLIALRKLSELEEKKLWQRNEIKLYYTELTDILRTYIEHKYNVIALEMPTDEILAGMRHIPIDPVIQGRLRQLLELSDMVKFAKASPLPSEHQLSLENGLAFVKGTIQASEMIADKKPDEQGNSVTHEPLTN